MASPGPEDLKTFVPPTFPLPVSLISLPFLALKITKAVGKEPNA